MEQTLRIGDIVLANGLAYIASDPQRGDNRTESYDSRGWREPYVCKDDILGKMLINIPVGRLMDYVQHQTENPVKYGLNIVK